MFYSIQCISYLLFLLIDSGYLGLEISSAVIKYFCVVSCFVYSVYRYLQTRHFDLQVVMLLCMVVADYFLLFTKEYQMGILLFCIVQCCYTMLLFSDIVYVVLVLFYLGIFFVTDTLWLGGIYGLHSLYNLFLVNLQYRKKKEKKQRYLCFSLVLLLLCDIHVAMQYIAMLPSYQVWIGNAIWLFYVPAIWCLLNSYTCHLEVLK